MILHYIRISLRNLSKYKTQTAISILAMAVSLTLMAVVSSMALSIKPTPMLSQPYADRTVLFSHDDDKYIDQYFTQIADSKEMALILGHQFKGVEEIHYSIFGYPGINISSNSGEDNERSLLNEAVVTDKGFLRSQGIRSVYTGKVIETLADNETVITEKLARKLFGKENPIGKSVNVGYFYFNNGPMDKTYTVKDVMENPSPTHKFFQLTEGIFVCEDELLDRNDALCYFILKEGASVDELTEELNELLGSRNIKLLDAKDHYSEKETMAIRNAIILFLFLFVLVAFSNYLRQQTQLFRLREREVALRTCIGCQPSSMLMLFFSEILIVLLVTLALSLIFISLASGFLTTRYTHLFTENNYSMSAAVPVALITIAVLIAISMIVVTMTVRRIRRDQTGLALRMKPMPKHRLRNAGLTVQMTVSIVFTCVTVMFFMSVRNIKEYYGIPDDADRYKKYLTVRLNGFSDDQSKVFFGRIESLQSVDKVYRFLEYMTNKPLDDEQKDYITYHVLFQHNTDAADFYGLKSEDINAKVNPDRFAIVSEATKQTLVDRNLWNGKTVEIPHYGDYEIKGVVDRIPFLESSSGNAIVVYDISEPMAFAYTRIITPKAGMENQVRQDIEDVIHDVFPSRIDIKPKSFYQDKADNFEVIKVMITMIYVLSIISVVTTMAAVYAGVSLDTRRRRKEMALRKLNGAGPKTIAMIFTRTYLWIVAVAALVALPLCFMLSESVLKPTFLGLDSGNVIPAYFIGLLLIIAVTALTIAWKIRDIMHADPIEYLKE
ncbi:MAG: ABC transporter permease [Muribaculaceae bacterium]|nr:ABC transporter permease [Muribaculaceae bacterium]